MNTSIDQALQPISDLKIDDGDHEKFSHYVKKDQIVESAVTGKPVIALCGKVWVPNRDPQKFPICPQCQEIYNKLKPAIFDSFLRNLDHLIILNSILF